MKYIFSDFKIWLTTKFILTFLSTSEMLVIMERIDSEPDVQALKDFWEGPVDYPA